MNKQIESFAFGHVKKQFTMRGLPRNLNEATIEEREVMLRCRCVLPMPQLLTLKEKVDGYLQYARETNLAEVIPNLEVHASMCNAAILSKLMLGGEL
jgi:hypothetical protein